MHGLRRTLSIVLAGSTPPSEFRIFVPGWNETENGNFLFDEASANSVMAAYAAWGVDLAIDLEHQMLSPVPGADPTARDARGWCNLELRPDGSLWAVNVKWTNDGAARLAEKRQRYVSPAFEIDPETQRVTKIVNVAITAIPATHATPALVAASVIGKGMDPKLVQQALDALIEGDDAKAAEILKGMIASAASGEPAADPTEDPSADPTATERAAEPPPASDDAPPSSSDGGPPSSGDMPPKKKKVDAYAAARAIVALTGSKDVGSAVAELIRTHKIATDLEAREAQLAADRVALEGTERRSLVAQLVKLGAETPATAWQDDKGSKPCKRLVDEPIADLRTRVKALSASRPAAKTPAPPAKDGPGKTFETPHGVVTLSARELGYCAETKADPAVYAANKARLDALKTKKA